MKKILIIFLVACLIGGTYGLIETEPDIVCGHHQTWQLNEDNIAICIDTDALIANCAKYNKADNTKCFECLGGAEATGSSPDISACTCTGKDSIAYANTSPPSKFCVKEIANCYLYNRDNTEKCAICYSGAIGGGTAGQYDTCDCGSKQIVQDTNGFKYCIDTVIDNCIKYIVNQTDKCHTCATGANTTGDANAYTECNCDGVFNDAIDENQNTTCVARKIQKCKYHSSADPTKCHTCISGTVATGESPNITACDCTYPDQNGQDDQGNSVCITEENNIFKCGRYNRKDLSKCYQCSGGYEPGAGISPYITECVCESGTYEIINEGGGRFCTASPIPGCKWVNSRNKIQCHTCHSGYTEGEGSLNNYWTCDCNGGKKEKTDENSDPICVTTEIENCKAYNSENPDECHSCLPGFTATGTSPNITKCTCPESTHQVRADQDGNHVCKATADLMPNCSFYNKDNIDQCAECFKGSTATGTAPAITECSCASPKVIKEAEDMTQVCVTIIEGCDTYSTEDQSLCYGCGSDFTGVASGTLFSSCACKDNTKTASLTQYDSFVCGANIENCEQLNYSMKDKCYKCVAPYLGTGEENLYTECSCPGTKIAVEDEAGVKHCAEKIDHCETYLSTDQTKCQQCQSGFIKQNEGATCGCSADEIIVEDSNQQLTCAVEKEGCLVYLASNLDKCYTCASYTVSVGGLNEHSACILCQGDSVALVFDDDSKECGSPIAGCQTYSKANEGKCHVCGAGLTGVGSDGDYTACDCPVGESVVKDEYGNVFCIDEVIENCSVYNSGSYQCYSCYEGITGTGSEDSYSVCPCESPSVLFRHEGGDQICMETSSTVDDCVKYKSAGVCGECVRGFSKDNGGQNCNCSADLRKKDSNNEDMCIERVIAQCTEYSDISECGACEKGFILNANRDACENEDDGSNSAGPGGTNGTNGPQESPQTSSSSLLVFSLVYVLLVCILV